MTPIERYASLPSTQRAALDRARAGAPPGTTLVAEVQEAGIGRADHRWTSPKGGLYLSRIAALPPRGLALVPMGVAASIGEALADRYRIAPRIRWPNDLVEAAGGRKIGGILGDRIDGSGGPRLVVGVGINVTTERSGWPEPLRASSVSLSELTEVSVTVDAVEGIALAAIDRTMASLATGSGARDLVADVEGRLEGIGRAVALDGRPAGVIVGLDPSGGLVTEAEGIRAVHRAGTLSYVAPPAPGRGSR